MKLSIPQNSVATNNIQNQADVVIGDATNLKKSFDQYGIDEKNYNNNTLIPALNGNDGSKMIGHDSLNIVSDNVSDAIEEVRQIAVEAQGGTIIDGSITDTKLSNAPTDIKTRFSNFASDYEYQTPTIVGQEIQIPKLGASLIAKFFLNADLTGGAITISTDGGATSIALKNGAGEAVTELTAGLWEVAYVAPFFILRSGGGLKSFFGDGSDGTIPNLNTATSAPNGGVVANLWDMNAGTTFTTGTLSSASDQVVLLFDFGKPIFLTQNSPMLNFMAYNVLISTGATRNLALQYSSDNVNWAECTTNAGITTSSQANRGIGQTLSQPYRYWRVVLKSGGSNCTLTMSGACFNSIGGEETTKVFRILEPSTLNGAAVIKQYTSYVLPVGYEHTVQNPCQGLIIYSQGDVTVNGIIDMSRKAGLAPNGNPIPMIIAPSYIKTAKTSSLLHFDNNITDDSGRTWTNNGSATFDATNKKFGTHAISFNGTNQWIDTPASDDFSFGNEDFTIDFWMRTTNVGTTTYLCGNGHPSDSWSFALERNLNNTIRFVYSDETGTNKNLLSTTTILSNTFYHIAVVRNNQTVYLFINGNLEGSVILNFNYFKRSFYKTSIGRNGEIASNYFAGQIDEFRIIKGKAMYTANFTPPTSAYTYQATYSDEVEAFKEYYQMTTRLQMLRGGYGGNGGYGGGYSGSTGRQTSVGIGGAGRQNLGGFGGGGSGGAASTGQGGIGGSILNPEIGGGFLPRIAQSDGTNVHLTKMDGVNGSGAHGAYIGASGSDGTLVGTIGYCNGGGVGGAGGIRSTTFNFIHTSSQYAGGFLSVICKGNFLNTGTIRANGGSGSNGSNGSSTTGGAGGGSSGGGSGGGVIAIFNKGIYTNSGTIQVNGGTGGTAGTGSGTGEAGGTGTSGSVGSIVTQSL